MFFIKKILNLFNSKRVLHSVINHLDDDSMVAKTINCKANVLTDVSDSCLKMKFEVNSKIEGKDMNIIFSFNFVLPPKKKYNPQEVAKRFNNLTNTFVKEFKIGNKTFIKDCTSKKDMIGLREKTVLSVFAQKTLSKYLMSNKGVYQHALEALCSGRDFNMEQSIKSLCISRYYDTYKEWRIFRYKTCNLMFKKTSAVKGFVKVA